jgi:hypothetical protein
MTDAQDYKGGANISSAQHIGQWYTQLLEAQARIAELDVELHMMKAAGVIEVAVRNSSVSEYMAHWEGRTEKAEARIAELEASLEWYAAHVADCRKIGRDGDVARGKLDRDGGSKARAALKASEVKK